MKWLAKWKNDLDYINVYGRMKSKPNEIVDKGDYFYCVDEEDWFMTNLMDRDKIFAVLRELKLKECGFPGVIEEQYQLFDEILWEEHCYLYYYEGPVPEINTAPLGKNTVIRKLEVSDAKVMNEYYTYQSEDSINYIEAVINEGLAFGIEDNGQLVSWVVKHLDGSMGIMYTLASHRRFGYADLLTKVLIKAMLELDETPYIHIEVSNHKSMSLAEKNGFKKHKKVVWFGIKVD